METTIMEEEEEGDFQVQAAEAGRAEEDFRLAEGGVEVFHRVVVQADRAEGGLADFHQAVPEISVVDQVGPVADQEVLEDPVDSEV